MSLQDLSDELRLMSDHTIMQPSLHHRRCRRHHSVNWCLAVVVFVDMGACAPEPQPQQDRGLVGEYPAFAWRGQCGRPGPRCVVTSHGAVGDGVTDDTNAIRSALEACGKLVHAMGGHTVAGASVVLPGASTSSSPRRVYLSGAVNLTSGVDLVIEPGATMLASTSPNAYPVVPHLPGYPQVRVPHFLKKKKAFRVIRRSHPTSKSMDMSSSTIQTRTS
jgi:hypothetical protein